jgi:two-component system response regulator LytT
VTLSALVVDDEALARDELVYLLEQTGRVGSIREADSGAAALREVHRLRPDLVFLDVQMPEMDGFAVARALTELPEPPAIVFATAYDEYAIKAFEVHAADYLLKPLDPARVAACVARLDQQPKHLDRDRLEELLRYLKGPGPIRRVPLDGNGRTVLVSPSEVLYASSGETGTIVVTTQGEYTTSLSLQELEERLGPAFLRVHRQYIANMERVREFIPYPGGTASVGLGPKLQVPVARTQVRRVKEILGLD